MKTTWVEKLIIAAVAALLILAGLSGNHSQDKFEKICKDARGTVVYDGRQYQCIKP